MAETAITEQPPALRVVSPEELQFFLDNGYVHLHNVIPEPVLQMMEQPFRQWSMRLIHRWMKRGLIDNEFSEFPFERQLYEAWIAAGKPPIKSVLMDELLSPKVFDFLRAPAFTNIAADLLESPNVVALSGFIGRCRLPQRQSPTPDTPWHQDGQQPNAPARFVPMWVPMRDVGEKDSCLQVAAGHHREGVYPYSREGGAYATAPEYIARLTNIHTLPMKRGDVLVMDGLVPHVALPNDGDKIRWSYDIRYARMPGPDDTSLLDKGFICAHQDPARVETSYEVCHPRIWGNVEQWRNY